MTFTSIANYNLATKDATASDIAAAQSQISQAKSNLARLLDSPTQAEIAAAKLSLDQTLREPKEEEIEATTLRVNQSQISLSQNQLSLAQTKSRLADAQLIAPWTGTVLSIESSPGALVGSGSPIVTLLDMTKFEFHTTNFSERDLAQIFQGQIAVVTLKAYPKEPIEATVERIGLRAGAAVSDAVTFPVMLVLSQTDMDIRLGMTGRVEIRSEE
ncbi:MAG: hypothetical protein B6242_06245 [Anaerolineaceae bacterium 4572_78]|nr:MAG: hypothetical protein B6242_06245 [Anaerolineaceae bacterium 4572_78]